MIFWSYNFIYRLIDLIFVKDNDYLGALCFFCPLIVGALNMLIQVFFDLCFGRKDTIKARGYRA